MAWEPSAGDPLARSLSRCPPNRPRAGNVFSRGGSERDDDPRRLLAERYGRLAAVAALLTEHDVAEAPILNPAADGIETALGVLEPVAIVHAKAASNSPASQRYNDVLDGAVRSAFASRSRVGRAGERTAFLQAPPYASVLLMFRPDSPDDAPDDLLLFAPVPQVRRRADGWSPEVQRAFVGALERCGTVAAAARSVGRSGRSAYQLRARAGDDHPFARAWDEAQRRATDRALDECMAGGMAERRTAVFHRGRHVGWRTQFDNRLAYAALRALDRRDALWARDGVDARSLLDAATELLNGRESREAKPDAPRG